MFIYTGADNFPDVRIYDTNDPVLGGISGQSNEPLEQLVDRTNYLRNRLGSFLGQRIITANSTITVADVFKLIKVVKNDNVTLSLDPVGNFVVGQLVKIKAKITASLGKSVAVIPDGAEVIEDGNTSYTRIDICDGEDILLMATNDDPAGVGAATYWELVDPPKNLYKIGKDDLCRQVPRNAMITNGNNPETGGLLSNRADFFRLWSKISADAIDDATWLSNIRYRQFFSSGNGTTTFRWPDMRSMMVKGLDLSRGLSLTRLDNVAAGLELDAVKQHNHSVPFNNGKSDPTESGTEDQYARNPSAGGHNFGTFNVSSANNTGATPENLVKTVGMYPVIYY